MVTAMREDHFFDEIQKKFSDVIITSDLYSQPFAEIYDTFQAGEEELSLFLSLAMESGNKVLELCCGNGRMTIPFAQNGFDITGIDVSEDMLSILEDKKKRLPASIAKKIHVLRQDVFSLDLKEQFDFIFLPAITLCILMDDPKKTAELFGRLEGLLTERGCFAFDIRDYEQLSEPRIRPIVLDDQICFSYERIDRMLGRAYGQFLSIKKDSIGRLQLYSAVSNKKMILEDELQQLIGRTNFQIAGKESFADGSERMKLVILKRKEETPWKQ